MALEEVGRPQVATPKCPSHPVTRPPRTDGWRHHQRGRRCMTGNHVYGKLYRGFEPEWNHPRSGRFHGGRRCSRSEQRAKRVVNPTLSADVTFIFVGAALAR
jgi:hypothetical protein